ncbi:DNA glycosylase [Tothia fuscella]|uniref:DNA glycosylase n=1 Tax=Tothia fuscella TaxID=1048955 RepID=A0A9P4NHD1_9PEZI|nr:DNA glycosylase [Tothia fuscella]
MTTRVTRSSTGTLKQKLAISDGADIIIPETKKRKALKASKANITAKSEVAEFKVPELPQTPNKRRKTPLASTPDVAPPDTPTPSAIGVMATDKSNPRRTPAKSRKVGLHATNAPLQTPCGSRIVAYPSNLFESQSSQDPGSEPRITTDNLLEKACAHLTKQDPRLKVVIDKHHCKLFSPEGLQEEVEPFTALASGIMAQQVSGAAASSIKKKFVGLFPPPAVENPKHFPTPEEVTKFDIATLRTAGLSQRKAEYIHGLAEKFASGELSARMLIDASDDEVLEKLIAVRGLGRWSVEMFACFGLKRTDIFSTGDLGVQRGMATYMGKDVSKLKAKGGGKWKYMSEEDMLKHSEKFSPYRSLFMWYMWRIEDVNLEAIQGS